MTAQQYFKLLLILILLLLVGCRGGAKVLTQEEGFDFSEMTDKTWAVGGVVVNTDFVPDGAAQKELQVFGQHWSAFSENCSPLLFGALLRDTPELELWSFGTVLNTVPAPEMQDLFKDLEQSRSLRPDDLNNLSNHLPDIRYMVFGRLDDTRLETNQDMSSSVVDQMNRDGREPHGNTLFRTTSIRRGVYMSMEVYDLSTGLVVWSGEADAWDEELLDGDSNQQSTQVQVLREEEGDEVSQVLLDGTMREGPGLVDGIRDACVKLAAEMKWSIIRDNIQ